MLAAGLMASVASAGGLYIGGFGASPMGGDTEDPKMGGGALLGVPVNENVAIEAAGLTYDELDGDMKVVVASISLKLSLALSDSLKIYGLGGGSYIMPDEATDSMNGMTAKLDFDPTMGYHFGGGAEAYLNQNICLFADYVHTISELEGEVTVTNGGVSATEDMEDVDYAFGMARFGLKLML